ncbi:nucleoside deaminase [Aquifex pyrophilus]
MDRERFINLALKEAERAFKEGEVPVGCVIVRNNEVISLAHNEVERRRDPTAHAEILAIKRATEKLGSKFLTGCEAFITLEPCVMCSYAFVLSRIDKITFLAPDKKHGGVMSLFNLLDDPLLNHRVKWEYYPVERASELISEFFKSLRDKIY